MIAAVLQALALAMRMHALWPTQPLDRVVAVSYVAVRAETYAVPAEILVVIAEHESDLQARAVSYRRGGRRVDRVVDSLWTAPPGPLACGLVQTIAADHAACERLLDPAAAIAAGATELDGWLRYCRGSLRCALAGYAGGVAGARAAREGSVTQATRFADLFLARTRRLRYAGAATTHERPAT